MTTSGNIKLQTIKPIPHWMVLTLCWLFAILYGVWILPETVFIRHFCLVVGALLSLYVIYPNRRLLLKKEAAPIWIIGLLILWVTFHLFFIGRDFNAQWEEYTRIWKKIAVGSVFAIGLGIALISQSNNQKHTNQYWRIIYLGFLLPAITYYIKLFITTLGLKYGFHIPVYLMLDNGHMWSRFGISRAWYVFFCLPAVAISIGILSMRIKNKKFSFSRDLIYLLCIPLTLLIFYIEGDRSGIMIGLILLVILKLNLTKNLINNESSATLFIALLIAILLIFYSMHLINKDPQWGSLISDIAIAIEHININDSWKNVYRESNIWPTNKFGDPVNNSTFLRITWAIIAVKLILEDPLGYGLLSLSFGALCKERWPDSVMSWSHSGLLDFSLGYGIPGILLVVLAIYFICIKRGNILSSWLLIGSWVVPTLTGVLLIKELSSEIFISAYIFIILLSSTFFLNKKDSKYFY